MARPKVLVTGASGLIGGLVIARLGDRYELHGLSRRPTPEIPHVQASVTDLDAVRRAAEGMDIVLHLAAYTDDADSWDEQFEVTAHGTLNVFRAAADAGVWRVVLMSTGSTMCGWEWYEGSPYGALARGEYETVNEWELLDARTPTRPDSPYGACKIFAEACGRWFSDRHGISVPVIRLGAVLPEDRPNLIRQFPGWLSQDDAVQMIDRCLSAPPSLRYEIFDAISENRVRWRDTSPAKEILGWRPTGSSDRFDPEELRATSQLVELAPLRRPPE